MRKFCLPVLMVILLLPFVRADAAADHEHNYVDCYCVDCDVGERIDRENLTIILTRKQYQNMVGYEEDAKYVTIPDVYYSVDGSDVDGYIIAGLDDRLFWYDTDLVSVTLPDTVTHIGQFCFEGCENLESVTLSENLTVLRKGAFYKCSALKGIMFPDTMIEIGSYSFDMCSSLEYADMQEGLITIGKAAFQRCGSLKWIDIPDSVEYIGNFAFNHCSSAENEAIVLPSHLKLIGVDSEYFAHDFYNCGKDGVFTEFQISEDNEAYEVIDGILYTKGGEVLISIPRGKTFENNIYYMPDTVTRLGELSFSRNLNMDTVVISDNLILESSQPTTAMEEYNNNGNDLHIASYVYVSVKRFEAKSTNENYISQDGILYTKDGKELVAIPSKYEGIIDIPEGVECIADDAVWTSLTEYPESWGPLCFNNVTEIHIPSTLTDIPEKQLDTWNALIELHGIVVTVDEKNPVYTIVDGQIIEI